MRDETGRTEDNADNADNQEGRVSPFEAIKHVDDDGGDWWSARALATMLGYSQWQKFMPAIAKAMEACANSAQPVEDHFVPIDEMRIAGKGARRRVRSYKLSRYACYLIIQNADPAKEIVALGQTYFAVQTRRQEQADELAGLSEAQRRLYLRHQLAEKNKDLAATAYQAGVLLPRDFALFQDHGYRGLYAGLSQRDIHRRKGLGKKQAILDHMGSEELAANWFRATQADQKIRREGIQGKENANQAHYEVGQVVRRAIAEVGGTMPEDLPTPKKSIQQIARDEAQRQQLQRQPPLFREIAPPDDDDA